MKTLFAMPVGVGLGIFGIPKFDAEMRPTGSAGYSIPTRAVNCYSIAVMASHISQTPGMVGRPQFRFAVDLDFNRGAPPHVGELYDLSRGGGEAALPRRIEPNRFPVQLNKVRV